MIGIHFLAMELNKHVQLPKDNEFTHLTDIENCTWFWMNVCSVLVENLGMGKNLFYPELYFL